MHDREKSDGRVVPVKLSNNAQGGAAEAVEGRRPAKGNAASETRPGRRAGHGALSELGRVRRVAATDKEARFTALLHHVDVDRLRAAYFGRFEPEGRAGGGRGHVGGLRRGSRGEPSGPPRTGSQGRVPGKAVAEGVHTEAGRAAAAARGRRAGGQDPPAGAGRGAERHLRGRTSSASPTGFGPGAARITRWTRSPPGSCGKKVNWVLDADFRDYFSSLDHRWLERFLEHRIADRRVLRLIQKWLAAGVIEDGSWTAFEEGVPQGASASPLLANVYLHYVFDLWAHQWRTSARARRRGHRALRR